MHFTKAFPARRWPRLCGYPCDWPARHCAAVVHGAEASYIVRLLAPYRRNFGKRLVKTPKPHFLDAGLAAWPMGIRNSRAIATHAMCGAPFETFVIAE